MTDRPSRTQPGHEGHGHGRAAVEGHRAGRSGGGASGATAGTGAASASTNGTGSGGSGGARRGGMDADAAAERSRSIATSPAVGVFQPAARAASGTRVRTGDVLGHVDVLGVPQEVEAPVDGIVGATLVEAGMAVEYGQELIRIELTAPAASAESR